MQISLAIAANNPQLQNSFTGALDLYENQTSVHFACVIIFKIYFKHFKNIAILSHRLLIHSPVMWFFSNSADATFSSFAESILRLINTAWQCFKMLPHVFLLFLFSPMQLL